MTALRAAAALLLALTLPSCATPPVATGWPPDLAIVGDGWPRPGDPCRMIGETAATADLLDHDATLVGCRSAADAARLGGRTVATVGGVTLVSVPVRTAGDGDGQADALVAGTDFHATATLRCAGVPGSGDNTRCEAGVRRHGPGGTATVTVEWPGGGRRVLLFDRNARPIGAEAVPGERPAPTLSGTRIDDTIVVSLGRERYEIPDVFVLGD